MGLISEEDRAYLVERFEQEFKNEVQVDFFTRSDFATTENEDDDPLLAEETDDLKETCQVTAQLFEELIAISPKIAVNRLDVDSEAGKQAAVDAGIDPQMLPALRFKSAALAGQSFYFGMPVGYEFGTLIETLVDFSSGKATLGSATQKKIAAVDTPLNILVFVTPT